jgi:ribonucleoside-diphosphate reductase alpha chain
MKELADIEKKAVNRPVPDLPRTGAREIIDVVTNKTNSEGQPQLNGGSGNTHAERVQEALGNMYMDVSCSNCGSSKVIRAGACGVCMDCGTSQGCS